MRQALELDGLELAMDRMAESDNEYRESQSKARAMFEALELAADQPDWG